MPEAPANENASTQDGKQTGGSTSTASDTFTPITSQADLDKAIGPRLERERGKFADYDDLKTKAAEFDKLADANKSEIEKANDRATQAQAEVEKIPAKVADALRTHLVELHNIDDEKAELFLTATEPDLLLRQMKGLLGSAADRTKNNAHVPGEGNTSQVKADPRSGFLRELTGQD